MAIKKITESPTITDTIVFDILTPDADGCFLSDPYKVDKVTIYYIQRDFANGNTTQYDVVHTNQEKEDAALAAEKLACESPTESNIANAKRLRDEATSYSEITPIFFNEAVPVAVFGAADYPAWLSTDNALLEHVTEDEDGNTIYGNFQLTWEPKGFREGDYFICWVWTPLPAGSRLYAHNSFFLNGNSFVTSSIPTHFTSPDKYEVLLERYLPEMFKVMISDSDEGPTVINNLNQSVAKGFTFIENLGNQIVDLLDANSIHEALLPYLANTLGVKMKSNDPTRWRRQIKRSVPLYKRKGTKAALEEALDQAGISLSKLTMLWQVVSPYTYQESFKITNQTEFILAKPALDLDLDLDLDNFELAIRLNGEEEYTVLSSSYVTFTTTDGVTTMSWVSEDLDLSEGDIIRVLYKIADIPNLAQQGIEDYIRTFPYSDQRDEADQLYPKKNWNVRVIEEDDPLFSVVIPNRHPFKNPIIFGKIRTEFPYSENMYMSEEYNGSIRDSLNPCDIDKNFLDPCGACRSSKYTVDLEINDLSNDKLLEAQDIIREYSPFHAVLHSINFSGKVVDFVKPPEEYIECLVQMVGTETVIAGSAQLIFGRAMQDGLTTAQVRRDALASSEVAATGTGTAYNNSIVIFCPEVRFDRIGLEEVPANTILEILSPSPNSGIYQLSSPETNYATILSGISEPINRSAFTFRVSNEIYNYTSASISKDNLYTFSDADEDFGILGVKTQWDIDNNFYSSSVWKIEFAEYSASCEILNILPSGSLQIKDDGNLPDLADSSVDWILKDSSGIQVASGTGELSVKLRGLVNLSGDTILNDIRNVLNQSGNFYLYYQDNGLQYKFNDFVKNEDKEFLIDDWDLGSVAGKTISIYHRLADNQIGYICYSGIKLETVTDYEVSLAINNGDNPPATPLENNRFKENFLISIGSSMYAMAGINGTTITLAGPMQDWTTYSNLGTAVNFTIYRYIKEEATISGVEFDSIDRRGKEFITSETEISEAMTMAIAFASPQGNKVVDTIGQQESINFTIEWSNGEMEKGKL